MPDWLTTKQAAEATYSSVQAFRVAANGVLTRRSENGMCHANGSRWLWSRDEIEQMAKFRSAGVSIVSSARLVAALRDGRIRLP